MAVVGRPTSIETVAGLAEPVRRALYEYVSSVAPNGVSRDQAAAALAIGRSLAAFHLDKLIELRLLEAEYRRISGRTGPGAGRPAKIYRRTAGEVQVSIPAREYSLMAEFALEALSSPEGTTIRDLARAAARRFGEAQGEDARLRCGSQLRPGALVEAVRSRLGDHGFHPFDSAPGEIMLRNCPFHSLAHAHRSTVCSINLALQEGLVAGVGADLKASLEVAPGRCCVVFRDSGVSAPEE